MSRVAVASTDGVAVNEHFGKAREFLIYEVNEQGEYQFIEKRPNTPSCSGGAHQAGAAALLADVEVVLSAQIGPGAERQLRSQGIIALTVTSSIDKALQAYGKRGRFIKNSMLRAPSGGCSGGGGCGAGRCH